MSGWVIGRPVKRAKRSGPAHMRRFTAAEVVVNSWSVN